MVMFWTGLTSAFLIRATTTADAVFFFLIIISWSLTYVGSISTLLENNPLFFSLSGRKKWSCLAWMFARVFLCVRGVFHSPTAMHFSLESNDHFDNHDIRRLLFKVTYLLFSILLFITCFLILSWSLLEQISIKLFEIVISFFTGF